MAAKQPATAMMAMPATLTRAIILVVVVVAGVVIVVRARALAVVHNHASHVAASLDELVIGRSNLLAASEVLAHHDKRRIHQTAEHGGVNKGPNGRRVEHHIVIRLADDRNKALELARVEQVARIWNAWLGVKEVHVGHVGGHNGVFKGGCTRQHAVYAVFGMHLKTAGQRGAPHVGLDKQDALARRCYGTAKVLGHEGLALIGNGARNYNAAHRLVDIHKADIGKDGLTGVAKAAGIGVIAVSTIVSLEETHGLPTFL